MEPSAADHQPTTEPPLAAIIVPCILALLAVVAAGLGEIRLACMLCAQMQLALLHAIMNVACEYEL